MNSRTSLTLVAIMLIAAASGTLWAQDYPTRSIRLIVPLTAGSGADIAGRLVAKTMSET
jgi:tripartite-type tricarboxylate transporter receptor subunit TctC